MPSVNYLTFVRVSSVYAIYLYVTRSRVNIE